MEEKVLQNAANSMKKKKKKKKKKKDRDHQDDSTQSANPDVASSSIRSSSSLGNTEEYSVIHHKEIKTNMSSDIPVDESPEPVVEHSEDDDISLKLSNDSVSKVKVGYNAVGNISAALDGKAPEKKNSSEKKKQGEKESENENPEWSLPAPNEAKSSSPVSVQKKRKNRTGGYLLSDSLNCSKKRNDSKETAADLKRFTEDKRLLQTETKERMNLHKIDMLMNEVGLKTLRELFMKFHQNWTNTPDDSKNLKKGTMMLKGHEFVPFNTGDIEKWDVSLITKVLLHSKKCKKKISKEKGYEDAIRNIRDQKNLLVSHKNSAKMTDDEFQKAWSTVSQSLLTIGADTKEIEDIYEESVFELAKLYRDMHLEEMSGQDNLQLQIISAKFDNFGDEVASKVAEKLQDAEISRTDENEAVFQEQGGPNWDEWLVFRDNVKDFNYQKNNYILITDAISTQSLENYSVLRSVPWKIVLDFDPNSEEYGMYHDFVTKENKKSLIDMFTPAEIGRCHASTINLARSIDTRKTQWMFVNGREKDNLASGFQTVQEWKSYSVKHMNSFLRCCSDPERLDKHKPIICVILPFQKETAPFFKVTIKRLVENFNEFELTFVGVEHPHIHQFTERFDIRLTGLSSDLLSRGLRDLLEVSSGKEYRMPTCQAKLPVNLTSNQYLYLQEYLDVLYIGCEELLHEYCEENKLNKILNEHRESFLSGNSISFVSLYDNHDARRELGGEIQNHIQRLLDKGPTFSTIVEIRHLPGTGGTTIARRVLWELHKFYPCAIARLEDYKYDFEEDLHFVQALADRIRNIHEICHTFPVVLLDGKHATIEALGNKLARILNSKGQRAVLLSCLHSSTKLDESYQTKPNPNVHRRFFVQVKLEDSYADKREFEAKYKDYIDEMEDTGRCRVFHFPLLAMLKGLKGFDSKLTKIIHDSFDDMEGLQKEIAAVVAYIQHYAAQPTPAPLVYKAFQEFANNDEIQRITYEEINRQLITEHLLNLMVPAKPSLNNQTNTQSSHESYTFQHPLIADMVLKRYYETQKSDVLMLTKGFLEFPIIEDDQFFVLVNDLFIRRRSSRKERNSILFEELKKMDVQEAAALFCRLAEKTGNAIVFAHAARFHANNHPPFFQKATELIGKAFTCKNAQPKIRIINDMKGGILHTQLKFMVENRKIESLAKLEYLAGEALQSFRSARKWPPTFPSPLTGEVKVWITCIEWITRYQCNGDTDKAFEFINSTAAPAFFHSCITNSFYLLDVVDEIIKNEPSLPEPEETRELVDSLRMSLLKTFNKNAGSRRGKDRSLVKTCRSICSRDKFPNCSETQLRRLQVHYILSEVESIESMKREDIEFLLSLLEYLVLGSTGSGDGNTYMARYLMNVALHIEGAKLYSLDKGLRVAEIWMQESSYNPDPYFYKMMVNFIKIIDGNQILCRDSYNNALEKCKEMSENSCRKFLHSHFLKKDGEGMNRLITRSALLSREPELSQNKDRFWTTRSRKTLRECCGRIRIRPKPGKRNPVYIELVDGNVEVYLGKNADIGNVGRDFPKGKLVYFVVSFNLDGPVANGVTFEPTSPSIEG